MKNIEFCSCDIFYQNIVNTRIRGEGLIISPIVFPRSSFFVRTKITWKIFFFGFTLVNSYVSSPSYVCSGEIW